MKYILTACCVLLLAAALTVAIFPKSLDLSSDFYDGFYSQEGWTNRMLERRIALIPATIGRYALSGPTERGVGISVRKTCELGDVCSNDIRVENKNYINDFYAITIAHYETEEDLIAAKQAIINLAVNKSPNQEYYAFEKHEAGWFSDGEKAFVLVQKGVCESVNNQPETC